MFDPFRRPVLDVLLMSAKETKIHDKREKEKERDRGK